MSRQDDGHSRGHDQPGNLARLGIAMTLVLVLPVLAAAQGSGAVTLPRSAALPNYERIPIGQTEALEGGAYLVRSSDALANWYNPAGLASAERTEVNASSSAYEATTIEILSQRFKQGKLRLAPIGSFFGIVTARSFTNSTRLRYGFSISNPVAWRPATMNFTPLLADGARLSYVSEVSLSRIEPAVAVGWKVADRVRLGGRVGVSMTSLSQEEDAALRTFPPETTGTARRTFLTDGTVYHVVPSLGAQWDVTKQVGLGLVVTSPGLRVSGSSQLNKSSGLYSGSRYDDVFLTDPEAELDYALPLMAGIGAAYRSDRVAFEVDVRYYGESPTRDLFSTDHLARHTVADSAGVSTEELPVAPTKNEWREVVNVSVGGNYQVSPSMRVHAGFNTDQSPVADPEEAMFWRVDLLGFSTGASYSRGRFGGALGIGYSFGESDPVGTVEDQNGEQIPLTLRVRTFRVSYALSIAFD